MDDTIGDVSTFLWWLGWRFEMGIALAVVLSILFGATTGTGIGYLVGLTSGLGLWYLGTKEIDRSYWTLLDPYAEYTKQVRRTVAGTTPHESTYTLNYSSGASLFVTPDERYFTTTVFVGDEAVTFHEGVGVDMVARVPYSKDEATEIRYEWLSSIQYEKPYVRLELTSGESIRYYANDPPDELLAEVGEHIERRSRDIAEETAATGETTDAGKMAERVQREFN
ncbi:hypothetical protein [Haladaptatus sp. T7]|uniref:hypothetical protein n=1 Tax=Haladaptatus sp. T7 TaxID=2029368 RepID=UPI0021A25973|nr:hypothetical protein [Haladaptatus sp. T7]GKZ13305.1 hypothetical protein HAL_11860 [Haladaptatus sp. T7]